MNSCVPEKELTNGFDPRCLFQNGFSFGEADLVQGGSFREVVGRTLLVLLSARKNPQESLLFKQATVIFPPIEATKLTESSLHLALKKSLQELRGGLAEERVLEELIRKIKVINAPSLAASDLVQLVDQQGRNQLLVIADVNIFRDHTVNLPPVFGATATRIPEDIWVPHVTSLCRALVNILRKNDSYTLLHVNEIPAKKAANCAQLLSVDNCYVAVLTYGEDFEEVLAARAEHWTLMALQGKLAEVKKELDTFELADESKLYMLARLANRAGYKEQALEFVRQALPYISKFPKQAAIHLATFAMNGGDDELAQVLMPTSPEGIGEQMWLEEGLEVATQLKNNELIAKYDVCLSTLVPSSSRLQENRDRRLLLNCQEGKHSEKDHFTSTGFTEQHQEIQRQLLREEPNYTSIIQEAKTWGANWFELATVSCAIHARSEKKFLDAANAAKDITTSGTYGRQATQILLYSIRSMLLLELVPKENHDYYRELFQAAFKFLACHPEDEQIRSILTSLLSVESCGDLGVPLVALSVLDIAKSGVAISSATTIKKRNGVDLDNQDIKTSIQNGLQWLAERGGGELGVTEIPRELIVANPDDVVNALEQLIDFSGVRTGEDVDLVYIETLVFLLCSFSSHTTHRSDNDIRASRLLASTFAVNGQYQKARDISEQILLMGQTSELRQRLAWTAFGDIHHRCRNHVKALVGMACALAIDIAVPKSDLWHEVFSIHRILRDLGLVELSAQFLPPMKKLLKDLGFDPNTDPRIIAAEMALEIFSVEQQSITKKQEILSKIAAASENALDDRNLLTPLAVLLGQAVTKVEASGGDVSSEIKRILEVSLEKVGKKTAETIKTFSAGMPTVNSVLSMFNEVQRAPSSTDIARDYAHIEIVARRILKKDSSETVSLYEMVFAVELLADHSVNLLSSEHLMTVEWVEKYAFKMNDLGCEVVFMAFDDDGELSVIHVANRSIKSIEQPLLEKTFRRRFNTWLEDYPYGYGKVDSRDGNNVFYMTMERLNIQLPKAERLVIVAEPALQQLTANLVLMKPEDGSWDFLAGTQCAIGQVPSLTWLSAAHEAKRSGKTAYKAWISANLNSELEDTLPKEEFPTSDSQTPNSVQTLDVALQRLSGCFESFGFSVDTEGRLPSDMADAGLAVVTAHGGLSSDGRYLRTIRDDRELIEAPSALANSLAGVEVVILFVCSGGRIDKSPWENSTTSLSKQILNRGSRVVIASPWPLNVLVTYNWLDPFLRAWEGGATVLDATKNANDVVARQLGDAPQYALAMRVYGDVLLTRAG